MIRRIAAWLLALAALGFSARAEGAVCLSAPGFAALVDGAGEDLTNDGPYEAAFPVREGALYAAGSRGEYRLYDASGRRVSGETFAMIRDAGDCLIFRTGGGFGVMNLDGTILLAPAWTQLVSNGAGGYLTLDGDPLDDRPDEILYVDADGAALRTGVSTSVPLSDISDDRMPFAGADGRFGAVDGCGRVTIQPDWRWIGPFSGGLAAAEGEDGRGIIDTAGNTVIEPDYRWLDRGEAMIAAISENGIDVYAPDGSALSFTIPGEGLQAALVGPYLSASGGEWARLYGADGALVCELPAGAAFCPGLDGQFVAVDGAWGEACQRLMNADGAEASGRFQRILPLSGGRYAWLDMPGRAYYSADLGGIQKSWDYGAARWGLMDGEGNPLTEAVYLEIAPASGDRLLLRTEGEFILSDLDGRAIRRWPATAAAPSS